MKVFFQVILLLILLCISFFFYKKYFSVENIEKENIILSENEIKIEKSNESKENNNLIKKLKYKVQLSKSGEYEINAKSSEISYINEAEIVLMNEVTAIFLDNKKRKITVTSNKAKFNTSTYDTQFIEDIEIIYFNNVIRSEKLDFVYKSDDIIIYEQVFYDGIYGSIEADNIKINLISKDINIFMDNPKNKVKITSNQ